MLQEAPQGLPRALDVQRFSGAREQEVRALRSACMAAIEAMAPMTTPLAPQPQPARREPRGRRPQRAFSRRSPFRRSGRWWRRSRPAG